MTQLMKKSAALVIGDCTNHEDHIHLLFCPLYAPIIKVFELHYARDYCGAIS